LRKQSESFAVTITIRRALAGDAHPIGNLARQFADYLQELGDPTEFRLTAEAYLRDGFGAAPAFAGLVAENEGDVIGYLLYHFGYDSDRATRNLHIVDLYVDRAVRRRGVAKALMAQAASIAHEAGAEEMLWSVYHLNALAATFYEKLGAQRITDVFFMKIPVDAF
jgi:ribosomal protein S18 acetylase RimI-like enzyme